MARKPLIAPGSFLPEGAAEETMDLQSRIIARDREKHGRGAAAVPANEPERPLPEAEDSDIASNIATQQPSEQHSNIATQQPGTEAREIAAPRIAEAAPGAVQRPGPSRSPATQPPSYEASSIASNIASGIASNTPSYAATNIASHIEGMRRSRLEQLNIRIPEAFNEWLEEEAHRRRKEGVTKQSIVTDALAALIRERLAAEAGEGA